MCPSGRTRTAPLEVNPVGDLEHVTVGGEALGREAREQSRAGAAAQGERELPGEVVGVVEARVQALAPEGAREVAGVAQQEAPSLGQPWDQTFVHAERCDP